MTTIIEPTPRFKPGSKDIGKLPELEQDAATYQEPFGGREQKVHDRIYLTGFMLNVPIKSVETTMLTLQGNNSSAIHRSTMRLITSSSYNSIDSRANRHLFLFPKRCSLSFQ
jgi:hypothetical protein